MGDLFGELQRYCYFCGLKTNCAMKFNKILAVVCCAGVLTLSGCGLTTFDSFIGSDNYYYDPILPPSPSYNYLPTPPPPPPPPPPSYPAYPGNNGNNGNHNRPNNPGKPGNTGKPSNPGNQNNSGRPNNQGPSNGQRPNNGNNNNNNSNNGNHSGQRPGASGMNKRH